MTSRSKVRNTERNREKNYKLYVVNMNGSSLETIRNEFKQRVKDGLRRHVFVIDVDELRQLEERRLTGPEKPLDLRLTQKKDKNRREQLPKSQDLVSIILTTVENCRREFNEIKQLKEQGAVFDLLDYWQSDTDMPGQSLERPKNLRTSLKNKSLDKLSAKGGRKNSNKNKLQPLLETVSFSDSTCLMLRVKEHNKIGRPNVWLNRKYIEDEPLNAKLYIVLLGKLNIEFYADLLRRMEPLQAIIEFLPEENTYDQLLMHTGLQYFINHTMEEIKNDTVALRKLEPIKPVGIFLHQMPVISRCLAKKYSDDIYNQLSWCLYDVDVLYQQYMRYYVQPFQETNVAMPHSADVHSLADAAQSQLLTGKFLEEPLPAVGTDVVTIILYLETLLTSIGLSAKKLTELETLLLATPGNLHLNAVFSHMIESLSYEYQNAFNSITKLQNFGRIFIEENNQLLSKVISYTNKDLFRNIFLCCLEYNQLRSFPSCSSLRWSVLPYTPYASSRKRVLLPRYVKLCLTNDGVIQNVAKLLRDYDEHEAEEIYPGCKLYCFRRTYNQVIASENLMVIPTRLCFRDFTIFQLNEFLEALVTPEMREQLELASLTDEERHLLEIRKIHADDDRNIYIRPLSLKGRKLPRLSARTSITRGSEKPKSEREKRKQTGSRTTVTKSYSNEDTSFVGLPPDHALLKGYNLEDVRQEICVNTQQYYFEEGSIRLYEERWCFDDMNKTLQLCINGKNLSFCCPRRKMSDISNDLRIVTKSDVFMRILPQSSECAQVLLNYPNGLTVYYEETGAEQVWLKQHTFNNEQRRIFTPYGAVIVHYNIDEDLILIMRYNGEVYELYQSDLEYGENEEYIIENDLNDVASKSSLQRQYDQEQRAVHSSSKSEVPGEPVRGKRKSSKKSQESSFEQYDTSSAQLNTPLLALENSIKYELQFLEFIVTLYDLTYRRARLITSLGRVICLTAEGSMFEKRPYHNEEWHDYFANESYAMHEDGLKMIWTKDALKCFHKDGTIMTTQTAENIEYAEEGLFDLQLSTSSSHNRPSSRQSYMLNSPQSLVSEPPSATVINVVKQHPQMPSYEHYTIHAGGEEEEIPQDVSFVAYHCENCLVQHKCYASVHTELSQNVFDGSYIISVEIHAADDVRIRLTKEEVRESSIVLPRQNYTEMANNATWTSLNEPETENLGDIDERTLQELVLDRPVARSIVNIWIGDELQLTVSKDTCDITATCYQYNLCDGKTRGTLKLNLAYTSDLRDMFFKFVDAIEEFKDYAKPHTKEKYFVERFDNRCERQGFEFYEELPELSKYHNAQSNTVTELTPFQTIEDSLENKFEWFATDMQKFPRFPVRSTKASPDVTPDFPMVLSVNTYVQIPRQLRGSTQIHKFLEPFDGMNFKTTRKVLREALDRYLRPSRLKNIALFISQEKWRLHHEFLRRRISYEQQRKSLYHAMLKHKDYPKYHTFMSDYCGHVKHVDFFEYIKKKCVPVKEEEPQPPICNCKMIAEAEREEVEKRMLSFIEGASIIPD